jgi:hypothetical protein
MQKLTDKFSSSVVQLQLFAGCPEYCCMHVGLVQHLDSAIQAALQGLFDHTSTQNMYAEHAAELESCR